MNRKKEVTARKIYFHAFKMQVVQEYDNGQISKRGLSKNIGLILLRLIVGWKTIVS